MAEWIEQTDRFLTFNEREILKNAGSISHERMEQIVSDRFKTFDAHRRKAETTEAESEYEEELENLEHDAQKLIVQRKDKE